LQTCATRQWPDTLCPPCWHQHAAGAAVAAAAPAAAAGLQLQQLLPNCPKLSCRAILAQQMHSIVLLLQPQNQQCIVSGFAAAAAFHLSLHLLLLLLLLLPSLLRQQLPEQQ
jgi:hypothetical protein